MSKLNVLFVCSRNQWRSPTAERLFQNDDRLNVRSCGVSSKARRALGEKDLIWADVVFVMESEHRSRIIKKYRELVGQMEIQVLHIPDEFELMDPELVELLEIRVGEKLERLLSH